MQTISNIPGLFNKYFYDASREKFARVHRLECEEVLDNLGYVAVDRNKTYTGATDGELLSGISRFREEYRICGQAFPESGGPGDGNSAGNNNRRLYPGIRDGDLCNESNVCNNQDPFPASGDDGQGAEGPDDGDPGNLLSEEELSFLHRLSSLEGEFDLHRFPLATIGSNALLTRVLNYRLSILGTAGISGPSRPPAGWDQYLEKLSAWCGLKDQCRIIELSGDAEALSQTLAQRGSYPGSRYHHLVYFKSPVNRLSRKIRQLAGNDRLHDIRFPLVPGESVSAFQQTIQSANQIEAVIADGLNQLMTRLVQVRLWLSGTYPGRLDNDLGPLSLDAMYALTDYLHGNVDGNRNFSISDLLVHIDGDYWVLNVPYLFQALLPELDAPGEKEDAGPPAQFLSQELGRLLVSPGLSRKAQESILETLDEKLQKGYAPAFHPERKPHTRAGKGLLRSAGRFFRHLGELIRKGIRKARQMLKKLFGWFPNAVQALWRELKTSYSVMARALAFFFSERTITTSLGGQRIVTDFDAGFDSITTLTSGARPLISAHIRSLEAHAHDLTEASGIAGTILSLALKALTGPCGWLRLGIDAIRCLAKQQSLDI